MAVAHAPLNYTHPRLAFGVRIVNYTCSLVWGAALSDNFSFVLHAPSDEAYATALAGAIRALPLKLEPGGATSLQFGRGVVCIVVWSDALLAESDALLRALSASVVLVARRSGALPAAWDRYEVIDASAATADAEALAGLSQNHNVVAFDRNAQLQGAAGRKQPMAVRSAYGMAATLAVASFIAPWIMERAQATDTAGANLQPPSAPAQGAGMLRASLAALTAAPDDAVDAIPSPTPALDRWLAPEDDIAVYVEAAPAVAETRLVAMTVDAEPLVLTATPLVELISDGIEDPSVEAFSYEIDASAKSNLELLDQPSSAKHNL